MDPFDETSMRAAYDVWHAGYLANDPEDPLPTFPEVLAGAQAVASGAVTSETAETWLLREADGTPVGCHRLKLPLADNLDLVGVDLAVHPGHQHRGHGRRLLDHVLSRCAELGRHQVVTGVSEPAEGRPSGSTRFAAAAGARRSLGDARRTLELETLDLARLAASRAEAEACAAGYQLLSWTGPCPDDLVDGYAALVARMSTDAPMGELTIEPEQWDATRVRERETVLARQGRTQVATVARRGTAGPLVAYTDIVVTVHDPANAFQWDTLVRREDRGHRLGLLVKAANLQRLLAEAPQARRVHTWNADVNRFMIAINEQLGFRLAARECAWRLDLPRGPGSRGPSQG